MTSNDSFLKDVRLDGKTAIITGANTGIGKETARELARAGARVILACRDRARAQAARDEIVLDTKNENVVVKCLDLSSLKSVQNFADDINSTEERIDILVNNAGILTKYRQKTEDGFEMMFGVNHLGHFHLTNMLLGKLKASAPGRIVIVASKGHRFSEVNLDDPNYKIRFNSGYGYSRSKTANILHGVQLAKILKDTGVGVYIVHPGLVNTEMDRYYGSNSWLVYIFWGVMRLLGETILTPEEGAKTTLYCCLEPSIAEHSGKYYSRCKEARAKSFATNEETAEKLWDLSLNMCQSKL